MTVGDALIDPNLTIKHFRTKPDKDPGYRELNQITSEEYDRTAKVIKDYQNRNIIKVSEPDVFVSTERQFRGGAGFTTTDHMHSAKKTRAYAGYAFDDLTRPVKSAHHSRANSLREKVSDPVTKELMRRKLYLMKLMVKNEKRANKIIGDTVNDLHISLHRDNKAVKSMTQRLSTAKH